jgi:predicted dehydrogenase
VKLLTADYHELLASPDVDVVYVAVPHNIHETIYLDVLKAGKTCSPRSLLAST